MSGKVVIKFVEIALLVIGVIGLIVDFTTDKPQPEPLMPFQDSAVQNRIFELEAARQALVKDSIKLDTRHTDSLWLSKTWK
jgi:hypothetical protein